MNWSAEKILLTGGNGFLGREIIIQILTRGALPENVSFLSRNPCHEMEEKGIKWHHGDIRSKDSLGKAFKDATIVFHCAAKAGIWGKKRDFFEINLGGTSNVLDACRKNAVKALVHTSSPSVAIPPFCALENADESIPYPKKYLSPYPESKAEAEKLVLNEKSIPVNSIRPHLIWGPNDPHIIPRIVSRALKRKLLRIGDGTNMVDISYIANAAHAHVLAAEDLRTSQRSRGKAYFISDGTPVRLWSWIDELLLKAGIPPVKKSISSGKAAALAGIMELVYSILHLDAEPPLTRFAVSQLSQHHYFKINAACADLGYSPIISPELALEATVSWIRQSFQL